MSDDLSPTNVDPQEVMQDLAGLNLEGSVPPSAEADDLGGDTPEIFQNAIDEVDVKVGQADSTPNNEDSSQGGELTQMAEEPNSEGPSTAENQNTLENETSPNATEQQMVQRGLTDDEKTKFEAYKQNPPKGEELKDYQQLARKQKEGEQLDTIEDKIKTGQELSGEEEALWNKQPDSEQKGEVEALSEEAKVDKELKDLDGEEDKIMEAMGKGEDVEVNAERLEQIEERRGSICRNMFESKFKAEREKMLRGEPTDYEKEVTRLRLEMRGVLGDLISLPKTIKTLEKMRDAIDKQTVAAGSKLNLTEKTARDGNFQDQYAKYDQLQARLARANVMVAEAKVGGKGYINEFKRIDNKLRYMTGTRSTLGVIGREFIGGLKNVFHQKEVSGEALKVARRGKLVKGGL